MTSYYTNVQVRGNKILYRGVENGRRVQRKLDYNPKLYVSTQEASKFTTIYGEPVAEVSPGTIRDCREFVERYKDVSGFAVYGQTRFEYTFIAENHEDHIDWDMNEILVANIDIETESENGFPEPSKAEEIVTAITVKLRGVYFVFGCGTYFNSDPRLEVRYFRCRDEVDLLSQFVGWWGANHPDLITGWNIKGFDIPYLVNRITKVLGEREVSKLSPWGVIYSRESHDDFGNTVTYYTLLGISVIDYIEIYKKYAPEGKSQESYKLDNIAHVELGERKLSYDDIGSIRDLHRKNFQTFIEYNIQDVGLVDRLEDKLRLLELALTLAYDSKTNYEDCFTQVRMWDILIYNHLRKKNMVVPQTKKHAKDSMYEGAYVKNPQTGRHGWLASFDLNSLYPHLIMQYNISPDTLIEPEAYDPIMRSVLAQKPNVERILNHEIDLSDLPKANATLTPNGQFFTKTKQGFLPFMMEEMYEDRKVYKKKAIEAKKEIEKEKDPNKKFEIEKRIARFNNLQLAKKVCLNSAYGALGNEFFRFFDIRQAMAITTGGQLSIRWIEAKLNQYMNKLLKSEGKDYVIASDTDSIYLSLDELVHKTIKAEAPASPAIDIVKYLDVVCEKKIQPYIDKSYQELADYVNAYDQKMQMKREAIADAAIWTAKKRYIVNVWNNEGVQYEKPKIKVMGLEVQKSSTPGSCREKLREAISVIINGTEEDVQKFIAEYRKEFPTLPLADISFPRSVNGLSKYRDDKTVYGFKTPMHVRGALFYNSLLAKSGVGKLYEPIHEGGKIKFIYLKEPNPIGSDVIAYVNDLPKEFDLHEYIDYNTQFEKAFVEPMKIILDQIGWKAQKVSSLKGFFKK